MRWNGRDWAFGLSVLSIAVGVHLFAAPSGRALRAAVSGLPADMPRADVEERVGGEGEDSPTSQYWCVYPGPASQAPLDPAEAKAADERRDRFLESMTKPVRRYRGPMYAVDIEYAGLRDQRFKGTKVIPILNWLGVAYLLAAPLLLLGTAEASRAVRRRA